MSSYCDATCDVYDERTTRARKEHRCDACRAIIRPGDLYVRVRWVVESSADGIKRCGRCQTTHLHLRKLCRGKDCDLWPDERLDCGLKYEEEWGDVPDYIEMLPLLGPAEASSLLEAGKP